MGNEIRASELPDISRLGAILDHRDRFLRFLTPRVENAVIAEDILQTAYVRALERGSEIRENESAVAWFYRVLRNAVIDHYRRRSAQQRALGTFAAEMPEAYEHELRNAVCACIGDVIKDLKPEYRSAIENVDLGGISVDEFAKAEAISPNNASVRLHRARKAIAKHLKTVCGACAEHRCLDCTCRHERV